MSHHWSITFYSPLSPRLLCPLTRSPSVVTFPPITLHRYFLPLSFPISLRPVSMREGQETQLADTSEIMLSHVGKRRSHSPLLFPEQPHPSSRTERDFWSAGERDIPSFVCSPWDFYEKFIELHTGAILVLCNDRSTVRAIQQFDEVKSARTSPMDTQADVTVCSSSADCSVRSVSSSAQFTYFPLLSIRHRNFVDICESYLFDGQVFAITEYVGFSLETLLQRGIRPSEPEIAYIISQAS